MSGSYTFRVGGFILMFKCLSIQLDPLNAITIGRFVFWNFFFLLRNWKCRNATGFNSLYTPFIFWWSFRPPSQSIICYARLQTEHPSTKQICKYYTKSCKMLVPGEYNFLSTCWCCGGNELNLRKYQIWKVIKHIKLTQTAHEEKYDTFSFSFSGGYIFYK